VPAPTPELELLHALPAAVATSSAYREDVAEVAKLVDGDLESAWNSRTGDLVGSWVAFRVPGDAQLTAIEMTAGFTKRTGSRDLFTGNHRVSRVRVTRDGAQVAEHTLRTDERGLQRFAVTGPGGDYRVEVLELLPGERTDWRETCISELRVLGHSSAARAASSVPSTAVGALPAGTAPASGSRETPMTLLWAAARRVAEANRAVEALGAREDATAVEVHELEATLTRAKVALAPAWVAARQAECPPAERLYESFRRAFPAYESAAEETLRARRQCAELEVAFSEREPTAAETERIDRADAAARRADDRLERARERMLDIIGEIATRPCGAADYEDALREEPDVFIL
jgi:hypothetical protein